MGFFEAIKFIFRRAWRAPGDFDLDNLKYAMNRAYRRQQAAWEKQESAWRRLKIDKSAASKAAHARAREEFERVKAEFADAKRRYTERLEAVKARHALKREERKELARKAGVPLQYLNDIWVTEKSDGTVHVYFGGMGKPAGPGHGHYAMDRQGRVTYKREPFAPHGGHNHRD